MAIDTNAAAVTVRTLEPVTVPEVALIVVVPIPVLVARPALSTVAVEVMADDHATVALRSWVLPSVNVPVAVNCCFVPSAIEGLAGITAIDASTAAVTVNVVVPVTEPEVALIFATPVPKLVAKPGELRSLLIIATAGMSELHCTVFVMFWLLPSVNVPLAVNCCAVPSGIAGIAGVMAIETSATGVTFTVVESLIEPEVALTLVLPTLPLLATPWLSTVAMPLFAESHVTDAVKSSVLPSLYVPVAFSCFVVPKAKYGSVGVIAIES